MRLLCDPGTKRGTAGGFTLAEVAVTLVIVGMTLLLVMEGLNFSKSTAAQASNRRVAVELALMTMARVESGMLWEELDGIQGTANGSYAEEGYEAFFWEIFVGDEELPTYEDDDRSAYFDNYAHRRYIDEQYGDAADEDLEPYAETGTTGGPYERVTVRVTFPKLTDQPNELTIERWIPLDQLYGPGADDLAAEDGASDEEAGR